jgi:O-antigen ligase
VPFLLYKAIPIFKSFTNSRLIKNQIKIFLLSCILVLAASVGSMLARDVSMTRTLWGLWGRNNGLLTILAMFVVALSMNIYALQGNFVGKFFRSLELASIASISYGLLQLIGADPVAWSKQGEVFSFFGNTNFASAVFSLCASTFLILILFDEAPNWLRLSRIALFALTFYLLIETKSIQGLAALFISSVLLLFIRMNFRQKIYKFIFLVAASVLGFILFLGTVGFGPFGNLISQYTVQLRYQYWLVGIKIGNLSPIWGVGVDSYGDYFRTHRPESLALKTSIDLTTNNAHNVFVQAYATLGFLGLVAVLIPVLLGTYFGVRILLIDGISRIEKSVVAVLLSLWSIAFFSIDNIAIAIWNYAFLGLAFGIYAKFQIDSEKSSLTPQRSKSDVDGTKYIAWLMSGVLFAFSWYASFPDRKLKDYMANPVNPSDASLVSLRTQEMIKLSKSPFIMETQLWNLASELNKMNVATELFEVLKEANEKYSSDFNILDLNAGYREQRGLASEAISFREKQIRIEPRHPRVWLSYAYDLKISGRLEEAALAFANVKKYEEFLSDDIKNQLARIEQDFTIPNG